MLLWAVCLSRVLPVMSLLESCWGVCLLVCWRSWTLMQNSRESLFAGEIIVIKFAAL